MDHDEAWQEIGDSFEINEEFFEQIPVSADLGYKMMDILQIRRFPRPCDAPAIQSHYMTLSKMATLPKRAKLKILLHCDEAKREIYSQRDDLPRKAADHLTAFLNKDGDLLALAGILLESLVDRQYFAKALRKLRDYKAIAREPVLDATGCTRVLNELCRRYTDRSLITELDISQRNELFLKLHSHVIGTAQLLYTSDDVSKKGYIFLALDPLARPALLFVWVQQGIDRGTGQPALRLIFKKYQDTFQKQAEGLLVLALVLRQHIETSVAHKVCTVLHNFVRESIEEIQRT